MTRVGPIMYDAGEDHRGIRIRMSLEAPGDAATSHHKPGECYEANLFGWRIVGPLDRVRGQIDKMLDPDDRPNIRSARDE